MKAGLVSLLSAESSISSLVGGRIFVSSVPDSAVLPNILILQEGTDELATLDATGGGLRIVEFAIECRADRGVTADALASAVRVYLDDFSGSAGSDVVQSLSLEGESLSYTPPTDASDVGIYSQTTSISVFYAPT